MALVPSALQSAMRIAIEVSWNSLTPDSDQIGIVEPFLYPLQRLFCEQVAATYDSWMQGATLTRGDLAATTLGPSALAVALRAPQFRGWSAAFTAYVLSIVWVPGASVFLSSGGGSSANILAKAAALQVGLDSLIFAIPGQFPSRREFADKIGELLSTYTIGTTITAVKKQTPPPTIEAPIS